MFGCGADRPFLRSVNMEPAEFLNTVWNAGMDDRVNPGRRAEKGRSIINVSLSFRERAEVREHD